MSVQVDVNGTSINYPKTGDTGWGDEATQFAIQVGGAFSKLGLDTGTTVDIPGTLDVTGATTLDSTLDVGSNLDVTGNTNLSGTLDVTGNTNLSGTLDVLGNTDLNGTLDVALAAIFASTVTIVDDLAVDTDTLFVDVSTDRVGINTASPSEALDVIGNIKSNGSITGTSATLTDLTVDTNVIKTDSTNDRVGINTTSPTVALDVTGAGLFSSDLTIGGVLVADDSTSTSAPPITFTGDTNTGIGRSAADTLDFITNGNSRFRIEPTGQIKAVYESQVGTDYNTQLDNGYLCRAWVNIDGTATQRTGTYTISGTTITVSITSHGLATGNFAQLDFASGDGVDGRYQVTVINANSYTVTNPVSGSTGGNVTQDAMIRASGNVSSITDNGTGDYTVNFTTAMPDANYSTVCTATDNASNNIPIANVNLSTQILTSSVRFSVYAISQSLFDSDCMNIMVIR